MSGPAPGLDLLTLALFGAILSYVWRFQDLFTILRAIQFPILVSLAALGLYAMNSGGRRSLGRLRSSNALKAALVVFLFVVLSGPFSLAKGQTFWFVFQDFIKTILLMVVVAAAIRHPRDAVRLTLAFVVGGVVYALYIDTQFSVGAGGRLHSLIMYDSNDLGTLLIFTIPLAIFFVFRGRKWWSRLASAGALVIFLRLIIKSGSRGAFLGLLGLALYFLFGFRAVRARTRVLIIAAGVTFMLFAAGDQYWSLMETLLNPTEDYNWSSGREGSGRMDVWKRGLGYMFDDPLTGVGARAFHIAEGTISSIAERQEYGVGVKWSAAHNSFVQVGAETGLGGLIAFIAAIWLTFRKAREIGRRYRRNRDRDLADASWLGFAIGGAIIGFVVSGSFVSHAYSPYLYIQIAILAGLAKTLPAQAPGARRYAAVARRPRPQSGRSPGQAASSEQAGAPGSALR